MYIMNEGFQRAANGMRKYRNCFSHRMTEGADFKGVKYIDILWYINSFLEDYTDTNCTLSDIRKALTNMTNSQSTLNQFSGDVGSVIQDGDLETAHKQLASWIYMRTRLTDADVRAAFKLDWKPEWQKFYPNIHL